MEQKCRKMRHYSQNIAKNNSFEVMFNIPFAKAQYAKQLKAAIPCR